MRIKTLAFTKAGGTPEEEYLVWWEAHSPLGVYVFQVQDHSPELECVRPELEGNGEQVFAVVSSIPAAIRACQKDFERIVNDCIDHAD